MTEVQRKSVKKTGGTRSAVSIQKKIAKGCNLIGHPRPTFRQMVAEAIQDIETKHQGASRQAIVKNLRARYTFHKLTHNQFKVLVNKALRVGVNQGDFIHVKGIGASGSFRLRSELRAAVLGGKMEKLGVTGPAKAKLGVTGPAKAKPSPHPATSKQAQKPVVKKPCASGHGASVEKQITGNKRYVLGSASRRVASKLYGILSGVNPGPRGAKIAYRKLLSASSPSAKGATPKSSKLIINKKLKTMTTRASKVGGPRKSQQLIPRKKKEKGSLKQKGALKGRVPPKKMAAPRRPQTATPRKSQPLLPRKKDKVTLKARVLGKAKKATASPTKSRASKASGLSVTTEPGVFSGTGFSHTQAPAHKPVEKSTTTTGFADQNAGLVTLFSAEAWSTARM